MSIKDWPAQERPREKLLQQGAQALTDAELLAIFLKARLRHEPHEIFGCLFLDTRHRGLAFEALFHCTIDGASVAEWSTEQKLYEFNFGRSQ